MGNDAEHALKTWIVPFSAVWDGFKFHEVRVDDRGFNVGDVLLLQEYEKETQIYTGRNMRVLVTYISKGGCVPDLPLNLCVMSICVLERSALGSVRVWFATVLFGIASVIVAGLMCEFYGQPDFRRILAGTLLIWCACGATLVLWSKSIFRR
jgi:uncharacterized membrane protein YeaQ/YmgE (transglycosylase-associated protein family)